MRIKRPVRPRFAVTRRTRFSRYGHLPISRQPPAIYATEGEGVRHATWLELFFDLVFIVALAELGLYLHEHHDLIGLLQFAGLFAIVWWVWLEFSYYADAYDTEDPISRGTMIAAMFGVIFLSATIGDALSGGSFAFAAGVLFLRVLLAGSHLRARHIECRAEAKPFFSHWIGLEVLVTLVWGLSLLVPVPGRYGLWVASFVLSTAGLTVVYLLFDEIEAQISHFDERLGLFTILVLGEAILAVSFGTSVTEWGVRSVLIGGMGFSIAVGVWWLYFQRFDERVVDRALRENTHWREARQRGIAYIYGHYAVHIGIVAAGIGIEAALEASLTHHALGVGSRITLCAGVIAFLLGSGVSHRVAPSSIDDRVLEARIGVATLLGVLAVLGGTLSPLALISLVALSLVSLIVFEGYHLGVETAQDSEVIEA